MSSCSSDDLCDLAEACGAMTIQEPSMFTFDPDKVQVIIVENSATTKMAELQSKYCFNIARCLQLFFDIKTLCGC